MNANILYSDHITISDTLINISRALLFQCITLNDVIWWIVLAEIQMIMLYAVAKCVKILKEITQELNFR